MVNMYLILSLAFIVGIVQCEQWFQHNKDCIRSSLTLQKSEYQYIWTIEKVQEHYSMIKKYNLETGWRQRRQIESTLPTGNITVDSSFKIKGTRTHMPSLTSVLALEFPWPTSASTEYGAELTICSHGNNLTLPFSKPKTMQIRSSTIVTFTWEYTNDDIFRVADLADLSHTTSHELAFDWTITRLQITEGNADKDLVKCPALDGFSPQHDETEVHSEFKHG